MVVIISVAIIYHIEISKEPEELKNDGKHAFGLVLSVFGLGSTNLSGSLKGLCRPCLGHLDKLSTNGCISNHQMGK